MSRFTRFGCLGLAAMLALLLLSGCSGNPKPPANGSDAAVTPPEPPANHEVAIAAGQGPVPRKFTGSRGREESVAWQNNDDRGHTIRFTDWPFREPQQDIIIEAGHKSKNFHIYKNQDPGPYTYGIFPPVQGDPGLPGAQATATSTGPPDPPTVVVGD